METRMTGTFNRVQLDPGIRYALASAYIFLANIVRTCVRVYKYIYICVYIHIRVNNVRRSFQTGLVITRIGCSLIEISSKHLHPPRKSHTLL